MRSFRSSDYPAASVMASKRGRTVSVCLPARDEAGTVGAVVEAIRRHLMDAVPVVDELVVVDDGSSDDTAALAARAGATVVSAVDVLPEYGAEHGKGQAMWRGVHVTRGDVVAFCDADIRHFDPGFVLGLVGPLLARDDIDFVKGFYERPVDGRPGQGGRVTELVARPLISVFFPHLGGIAQPLAGECAGRRRILEGVPFVGGYGVDLGLLIDIAERFGPGAIAQCDLGERVHRNRPLSELSLQSLGILQLVLRRSGVSPAEAAGFPWTVPLLRPGTEAEAVTYAERPPLAEVPSHRKSA